LERPKQCRERARKQFETLGREIAQDFRQATIRLKVQDIQAAGLAETSQGKLCVSVIIVRLFVNPVKERYAGDQFPAYPEDSRRLAHRLRGLREVFQHVGE
jgi:hypothetical protein